MITARDHIADVFAALFGTVFGEMLKRGFYLDMADAMLAALPSLLRKHPELVPVKALEWVNVGRDTVGTADGLYRVLRDTQDGGWMTLFCREWGHYATREDAIAAANEHHAARVRGMIG